ncbi:MAG: beta-galactosidase, partial [Candidatus Omnitrophota bacterium]
MKIEFDRYSLKIEGERKFIWSGAIHYFRMPEEGQWKGRLRMMKEAGLNAADVYIPWNYHTEAPGKYRFGGNRNVEKFLDEVEEAGLYLIARPGPYICAEIDGGGLPAWLIAKKNLALRCRREGRYEYDGEYMKYVREWWEKIVPRIAGRKNLILFQIENEYNLNPVFFSSPAREFINFFRKYDPDKLMKLMNSDPVRYMMMKAGPKLAPSGPKTQISNEYIKELYEWSRELGVRVPIFHNDIMSMGGRVADVDIMSIDDYAVTDFSGDWREREHTFAALDLVEEGLDLHRRDNPVFMAEFQGSWFDNWGGYGYDRIRGLLGTGQLDLATKGALSQRATLINYFMFCGGTTWGYLTSPDVYTSYDKGAPVSESGQATRRYKAIKWLIDEISRLGDDILETELDETVKCSPKRIYCRARKSPSGNRYIFLRNTGHG